MKVGILTMPQRSNYGGILQALALQTILCRLGHDVEILRRDYTSPSITYKDKIIKALLPIKYWIKGLKYPILTEVEKGIIAVKTNEFVHKYLKRSPILLSSDDLKTYCKRNSFNAYIVGSDQVWRPHYCPSLNDYFLEFTQGDRVKRIAYATSFGVDIWEYSSEETNLCKQLIKNFNAVAVREDSAVELCKKYLDINALHVLDPTMLLESNYYRNIVSENNTKPSPGKLFYYLLDQDTTKMSIMETISKSTKLSHFGCMPDRAYRGFSKEHLEIYQFPSPAQWLRSFIDAEMVVTDSFHGTVFSLIFNKPFWVLGNNRRGNTRMESLLRLFKLENRFVNVENISSIEWTNSIHWEQVNMIKDDLLNESINFLRSNLSDRI